jgi:hypothetical protein
MECFETFAAAMADFYAMHPPFLPNPNGDEHSQTYYVGKPKQASNNGKALYLLACRLLASLTTPHYYMLFVILFGALE